MSLLPQAAPNIPGLDIAATSLPAREVGGDLYTFYALSNGDYGVAIGDVTGKGIPAALYMAVSTTMLEAKGPFISDVAQLLSEMNVALFPHMQPNHMNTALCCVRLEPVNGGYIAHIANAGMVAPILRRGTECKYLEVGGIPVGMLRAGLPYRTLTLPVQPGDLLVLSSDGIVEAMNVQNELYSFERLVGRVSTAPRSAALEIQDWILADVRAFAGDAEQHDDVTLIVMMAQNDQ
jgi:sigma-B regulation protein RsbU (phosphoserine phosphatase)